MSLKVKEHLISYEKMSYAEDPGNTIIDNSEELIDCSLGINPYGYPSLIDSARDAFSKVYINSYPEVLYSDLKKGLSEYWSEVAKLEDNNIRVGNGSIGILERINRIFIDNKSSVVGYCPQFSDYMVDVQCRGGRYDYILLDSSNNYKFDGEKLISAIRPEHKIVYIDNPNNPTGQIIPLATVEEVIKEAEKLDVCVIVDEAYGDFMDKNNSAISLVNKYNNLLVTRTFSKGFGLAGIRVGYVVAGELLSRYYAKVDIPFVVPGFGQYFAGIALKDKYFLGKCRENIRKVKAKIIESCSKIKVLNTDMDVPIMALSHPDKNVDMYYEFANRNILTESGRYFIGLGKNFVRFRISPQEDEIISVIKDIEASANLR